MPSDLDLIEQLRVAPAPAMTVDLERVTSLGRQRLRRRTAVRLAALAAAGVAAALVAVLVLAPDGRRTTTPPQRTGAATTTSTLSLTGNGTAEIPGEGGSYRVWVTGGTLVTQLVETGGRPSQDHPSTVVLPSGANWVVVQGTDGRPAVLGVVPAGATEVDVVPGGALPPRHVTTARAGDFEAFLVEFERAPDTPVPVVDLTWVDHGVTHLAVGPQSGQATFDLGDVGRLVVSVAGSRLGAITARGSLEDTALDPVTVSGDSPGASYALGRRELPGGRVLVWGVVPQQTLGVRLHLDNGASAAPTATRPLGAGAAYLAYAVVVTGDVADVTGLQTTDRSGGGIGVIG